MTQPSKPHAASGTDRMKLLNIIARFNVKTGAPCDSKSAPELSLKEGAALLRANKGLTSFRLEKQAMDLVSGKAKENWCRISPLHTEACKTADRRAESCREALGITRVNPMDSALCLCNAAEARANQLMDFITMGMEALISGIAKYLSVDNSKIRIAPKRKRTRSFIPEVFFHN